MENEQNPVKSHFAFVGEALAQAMEKLGKPEGALEDGGVLIICKDATIGVYIDEVGKMHIEVEGKPKHIVEIDFTTGIFEDAEPDEE